MSGDMNLLQAEELYSGTENPIILRRTYQNFFVCKFDTIKSYPFDAQECQIRIYISGTGQSLTRLVGKYLKSFASTSVDQYEIREWILSERNVTEEGAEGIIITVRLGRNMFNIIMVAYLPIFLINIINQGTNYVCTFDLLVTVNITSMMVLTSIYLSISESLPTTASIKPVEVWLLFNLAYPFFVIIINFIRKVNSA